MQKDKNDRVRQTRFDRKVESNEWKYITVNILNKIVELQLDSDSDLPIINPQTWNRLKKPTIHKTNKSARAVTGDKVKFKRKLTLSVMYNRATKEVKVYIHIYIYIRKPLQNGLDGTI